RRMSGCCAEGNRTVRLPYYESDRGLLNDRTHQCSINRKMGRLSVALPGGAPRRGSAERVPFDGIGLFDGIGFRAATSRECRAGTYRSSTRLAQLERSE